jgi:hypothetical protein
VRVEVTKVFFLVMVVSAVVITPAAAVWVFIERGDADRLAVVVGAACAGLVWGLCAIVPRVSGSLTPRARQHVLRLANLASVLVLALVATLGVLAGSAVVLGFFFFLGSFLTGFVVLLAQRRRGAAPG